MKFIQNITQCPAGAVADIAVELDYPLALKKNDRILVEKLSNAHRICAIGTITELGE